MVFFTSVIQRMTSGLTLYGPISVIILECGTYYALPLLRDSDPFIMTYAPELCILVAPACVPVHLRHVHVQFIILFACSSVTKSMPPQNRNTPLQSHHNIGYVLSISLQDLGTGLGFPVLCQFCGFFGREVKVGQNPSHTRTLRLL